MLNTEQQYILTALRAAFSITEQARQAETPDEKTIASLIVRNGILLTVYQSVSPSLREMLRSQFFSAQRQSLLQNHEGENVIRALSEAGFDCIGLKGWELRKLYPNITKRQMVDLDVMVRSYHYSLIRTVMEGLGFRGNQESSWMHESFKKQEINIEVHKRLTDDSSVIRAWEKGIWDRTSACSDDGHVRKMSPEDFYIFHFVHLYKDFLNGSLGLRRIVDTWLLQREKQTHPMDMAAVKTALESFGMWQFHERMVHLCRVTMGEEAMDGNAELLLTHAFTYGLFGSNKSYIAGRMAVMGEDLQTGKAKSFLSAVFLPYSRMKAQFPNLEKWPVLLPVYWSKRIIRLLKGNRKRYRRMMDYESVSQEDFDEMKRFLKAGGVTNE